MPNLCINIIEIFGDNVSIKMLLDLMKSENNDFDFNNIVPEPKEFLQEKYSSTNNTDSKNDWYNWRVDNWGTRGNSNIDENPFIIADYGHAYISFDTAWSPSLEITIALSKEFPSLKLIHKYEEGGMDFSGYVILENGKVIEQKSGSYDDYPAYDREEDEKETDSENDN